MREGWGGDISECWIEGYVDIEGWGGTLIGDGGSIGIEQAVGGIR